MEKERLNILLVEYLTKRIIFFIERFGYHRLDIAESSMEAMFYLKEKPYNYIFLGGELGKYGGSCYEVVQFLVSNNNNFNMQSNIILHSWNAFEVDRILKLLPQIEYLPYDEVDFSVLDI